MKQHEEPADTEVPADIEDFRYQRVGYINQGRKSDILLAVFLDLMPGNKLPLRWHYRSPESFLRKHGHLGAVLWAASNNSHLLLMHGQQVLRIWHDTAKACYVDIADNVYGSLNSVNASLFSKVEDIPEANWKKSKPFTKRIKVWQQWQMKALHDAVMRTYGLRLPRL